MPDFKLTQEQEQAVTLAESGQNLKIEAYAGAGKTSTLCAIGSALDKQNGLYLAFNRAIADEAEQKFPSTVECRTAHSLAYRAIGYQYKNRFGRLPGSHLATHYLDLHHSVYGLSPAAIGNLILTTINRFAQSNRPDILIKDVPNGDLKAIEDQDRKANIIEYVAASARHIWIEMINPASDIPITHDVYLKLWAMSKPTISKDFILFDEAQDASPVMLDLVTRQEAQQIFVGDRYQQIYSWRGAVNAMQEIQTPNHCQISQSFRFGQPIADMANYILNENLFADVDIKGFSAIESTLAYDHQPTAVLCRTNSKIINTLINRLSRGEKVAVAGGCKDAIALIRAAKELIENGSTQHREFMLFNSWDEVKDFSESEIGSDLAPTVKLIEDHDIDMLLEILRKTDSVRENHADIVLSTAHKAKGREWKSVRLENDFRHQYMNSYSKEESNLLYVAATRAINNLDTTDCDAILTLKQGSRIVDSEDEDDPEETGTEESTVYLREGDQEAVF